MAEPTVLRNASEAVTLASSAARTTSGTGSEFVLTRSMQGWSAQCDLTAAATDVGDTLDVYIQTTLDGTNWVDVGHFTQMLGNGGAKRYYSKSHQSQATTEFENGTSLAAGSVRTIFGERWRVRWAITDADADASFTFSVVMSPTI